MKLDDLVQEITRKLSKSKASPETSTATWILDKLKSSVAIRVNTKTQADSILEVFKTGLYSFPYPFGTYFCWVEIPIEGRDSICYLIMPPDEKWPHWQIDLNPTPNENLPTGYFLWSADGRIGPYVNRPGGQPIGPTVFVFQDSKYCAGCKNFGAEENTTRVHRLEPVDHSIPASLRKYAGGLTCAFTWGPGDDCKHGFAFWDTALLPISIIMYIAVAPTHELDVSWRPRRVIGKGSNQRVKAGHYLLTPIRKVHFKRRVERYWSETGRTLEIPSFVRGHRRRAHRRFLSWRGEHGEYTNVKEAWVNPFWRGPELEEIPPHYSLNWGPDRRIESVEELVKSA